MINLLPKVILYPFIAACLFAVYFQLDFLASWMGDKSNPVRHENLEGMFLISIFLSPIWIGTLILALWKNNIFSTIDRSIAIFFASLIGLGGILSFALGFFSS